MKLNKLFALSILAILTLSLIGCGQKGPLEVESEPRTEVENQQPTR